MTRRIFALALAAAAVSACDNGVGVEGPANLSVSFATTTTTSTNLTDGSGISAALVPGAPALDIEVSGTNGTLVLEEIWVIVSEFEIEGELAECEDPVTGEDNDDAFDDDECEEFESPPSLVMIPTDGTELQVISDQVPLGSYTELEWSVEDIELDDDDEDEQELADVRDAIEAEFGVGVWPSEASMAIRGTFLADGATEPVAFTTFFDAEIEVEMELSPPLEITEEGANRELTIVFDPSRWFVADDGTVSNLADRDGELIEFELEFENGIAEIDRDDDEDDDNGDDDDS